MDTQPAELIMLDVILTDEGVELPDVPEIEYLAEHWFVTKIRRVR
jgi:hypothetical protein